MTEEIDVCVQAPTALPMRLRLNAMLASILSQSDDIGITMGSLIGL